MYCGLGLALWIVADCAALAWIDVNESWNLEVEFHVPARVIRRYQSRTAVVALKNSREPASLGYRIRPASRSARPRSVPLVVFLHGLGDCGSDNVRQLRSVPAAFCEETMQSSYPCAILAPQCPEPGGWAQQLDADTDLLDGILQMIDEVLADSRIDPNRIYLTGFSMGGLGSWDLAMRAPDRFAAVVPICGGGDHSRAARLIHVSLWAVHGADDSVVPVSESRTMIAAVETAGGNPRYLELPGVGHHCWDLVFREDSDVIAWMFHQASNPVPFR